MSVVHHLPPLHSIAAARQRNPKTLLHFDLTRVGYTVNGLDFLESDETGEHLRRDVVQGVAGDDGVVGAAVGDSGSVAADAGEGDLDGGIGRNGVVAGGIKGEVVGAEDGAEIFYVEEGFDGGDGGGVGGEVVN